MYNYLKVSSDVELFYIKDVVSKPRGVVVMAHGFTDHSGNYDIFVKALVKANYSVYRYDMRGHGKTKAPLGDIDSYHTYVEDLHTVVRMALRENVHVPLFTMGFSMGGLVSSLFGIEYPNTLSGQVYVGPAVGYVSAVSGNVKSIVNLANRLSPDLLIRFSGDSLEFENPKKKEQLEQDYLYTSQNPMRLEYFTVRFVKQVFVDGAAALLKELNRYRYPCYIAHGTDDPTVPVGVSEHFYESIASKDKTIKLFPKMRHTLFNEPNGPEVMNQCIAWLNERTNT